MDQDDLEAIAELKSMPVKELERVPHDKKKWVCQFKGCCNGTTVWDFGIAPVYFHPRKSIQWTHIGFENGGGVCWWMCGKHHKWFKRLIKRFDLSHIYWRCMDFEKKIIIDLITKEKTAEDYE